MKRLLFFSTLFILLGCTQPNGKWKTIEVGNYLFDFPPDFELVKEKGIDSYVGKIKGDSMWFGFDFGHYSNELEQTPQEFLEKGHWRILLLQQFMQAGMEYDKKNAPRVYILKIRPAAAQDSSIGKGCDYIAQCKYNDSLFNHAVYIPDEIKKLNFITDTVNNQYRKIVYAKDPQSGTTGIYIKDLKSFNESINGYLALSMATSNLTKQQQTIALKIFRTVRIKKRQ